MTTVNYHRVECDNCGASNDFKMDDGNRVADWGTWCKIELRNNGGRVKKDYCSLDCAINHLYIAATLTK